MTHDRYLLDRVATAILALDGLGGAGRFASYGQWEERLAASPAISSPAPRAAAAPRVVDPPAKKRFTYDEKREWESMEATILAAEARVAAMEAAVASPDPGASAVALAERYSALADAQKEVERLYARWAELEEKRK